LTTPLFTVEFKKTAAKELAALERIDQAGIAAAIEVLAKDPHPHGSKNSRVLMRGEFGSGIFGSYTRFMIINWSCGSSE